VLGAAQACQTAAAIAARQRPDGCIPWEDGRHADPWNHVEAAMGLDAGGLHGAAGRAHEWLRRQQRADGSWAAAYRDGGVEATHIDANFCAYAATGIWHHFLATQDRSFLEESWRSMEAAIECVLTLQQPGGEVWWARDQQGRPWPAALLSSCSSILKSLRCAVLVAERLGRPRPDWERAAGALERAIRERPQAFEPRDRYAMDWYYPVLAGAVSGEAATARLRAGWRRFVVPGLGVRCVADRPWVTVAESCELALALDAVGRADLARRILGWVSRLRAADGLYWTGATFPDGVLWPRERTTWTSAAVLLAADALTQGSPTGGLFKHPQRADGEDLAEPPRGERTPEDVERGLAAAGGVGEDVVDREQATNR
jgi:hypothetical protein